MKYSHHEALLTIQQIICNAPGNRDPDVLGQIVDVLEQAGFPVDHHPDDDELDDNDE